MMTPMRQNAPSAAQRLGLVAMAVALAAFAIWMWLAPLHSAVVTLGQVKAETNRKLVQHTDGGIVKRILVKDGDLVKQGQPLILLDDVKIDSNLLLLREMMVFESVKRDRLDSEQQFSPNFKPTQDKDAEPELIDRAYQRELRIFRLRRSLLEEQLDSYRRQLKATVSEQGALRRQFEATRQAHRLAEDELGINTALERDQFVARARIIALERAVAEYGAKLSEHEAQLAQSEQRLNDLSLRIASARSEYQRIAAEEFKDSNARIVQLREQLRPAEDSSRRQAVLAPVSGTVVGLRLNSPGELAPAREPLMEIVPSNEVLVVEAHVGVDAIEHLHPEQPTELRFTGFNARTTPMVRGRVSYVSADALLDRNGQAFYILRVHADADSLRTANITELKPGMAAEVYVLIEARSVIDYLLAPLTETLRRALRER